MTTDADHRSSKLLVALTKSELGQPEAGIGRPTYDAAAQTRELAQRALRADRLKHFTSLRGVNFSAMAQRDPASFEALSQHLNKEAEAAVRDPDRMRGQLVEVESRDRHGRNVTEFFGDPGVWMAHFQGDAARFGKINRPLFAGGEPIAGTLGVSRKDYLLQGVAL